MNSLGKIRSKRFAIELKIIDELKRRLNADPDHWTRITMKEDGCEIDIARTIDNKYHVSFPPYYDCSKMGTYKCLDKFFEGLDEVAEFLMKKGWQQK